MNLEKLRKVNASLLFDKYYYTYGTTKVDEYLINVIFYNKISFLPFKYGIPDFEKGQRIADSPSFFWNTLHGFSNGTEEEMISGSNNSFSLLIELLPMGHIEWINGGQEIMILYQKLEKNGYIMHLKATYLMIFVMNINNICLFVLN